MLGETARYSGKAIPQPSFLPFSISDVGKDGQYTCE
jgi:hypothetical protein